MYSIEKKDFQMFVFTDRVIKFLLGIVEIMFSFIEREIDSYGEEEEKRNKHAQND